MKRYNITLRAAFFGGYIHMSEKDRDIFSNIGVSEISSESGKKTISNISLIGRIVLVPVSISFTADEKYEPVIAKWKLTL